MKWLIHLSADDYWFSNPHSRFHIVKAFHEKGYKILWINPLGIRFPSIKKNMFFSRILRKINSFAKLLKKANKNFYVYTPFSLPVFHNSKLQLINKTIINFQIKILSKLLSIKRPILFVTSPIYGKNIKSLHYYKLVYYYSDLYSAYWELTPENRKYIEELDELTYSVSDLILCASKKLFENLKIRGDSHLYYLPHHVSFDLFNNPLLKDKVPADLSIIKKPIIGYYGTLVDSSDWELIEYCAKLKPHYNFVFIGRKEISIKSLEILPNVFFIEKKPYEEIPYYVAFFDVCILFRLRMKWVENSSPLKFKEYLAAGKPVVTTYIEEIESDYKEVVYISHTKEEFLNNLDKGLQDDNTSRITKGIELVKNDSWLKAADKIENLLHVNLL